MHNRTSLNDLGDAIQHHIIKLQSRSKLVTHRPFFFQHVSWMIPPAVQEDSLSGRRDFLGGAIDFLGGSGDFPRVEPETVDSLTLNKVLERSGTQRS